LSSRSPISKRQSGSTPRRLGGSSTTTGPQYAGIQNPAGKAAPEVGGLGLDAGTRSGGPLVLLYEVGGLGLDAGTRSGGPLVLLYSADLDETVAAVTDAGGTLVAGPYEFPGGRRFHLIDPSGNELGVWAES
jgi:hypothetical protein